jgi:CRP/FNR family transcriptional regulator
MFMGAHPGRGSLSSCAQEKSMNAPYGLEVVDNCQVCRMKTESGFCNFPPPILKHFSTMAHTSVFPSGAQLFVEGQAARGIYVLCSGKMKLFTTSREGKTLILKVAMPGDVLGLSAVISGQPYELTAEASVPCHVNFIERTALLSFICNYGEAGLHSAQVLSREFHCAYQEIHDLVLARSSRGKLARLLLSWAPGEAPPEREVRVHSGLTHEEMAQMIGASRETVTRLLSDMKRKRFISREGSTLVIRDRSALELLAS